MLNIAKNTAKAIILNEAIYKMKEENQDTSNGFLKIQHINPEPIGIYTIPIERHLRYKEAIWKAWREGDEDILQVSTPISKHLCNGSEQNLFKSFPEWIELKNELTKILLDYIKHLGHLCDEIVINSAWLNHSQEKSNLPFHSHSNSFISANYFVNFIPGKHSELAFRNDRAIEVTPSNFPTFSIPETKKKSMYNANYIGLKVNEGDILIWRSHQQHGYSTPNKANDRLTLSLNAMPKILDNGKYSFRIN